jgi:hypothetical protein
MRVQFKESEKVLEPHIRKKRGTWKVKDRIGGM